MCKAEMKRTVVVYYIMQLFLWLADASHNVQVQLLAPHYVTYNHSATLFCNHSVSESNLRKIQFFKDKKKILQYIKEKNDPFEKFDLPGINFKYEQDGKTIILKDVGFEAAGLYSCEVATVTPIYTQDSEPAEIIVIAPQTHKPAITFGKDLYNVGEYFEANCTSSPAFPTPHITWFINNKQVDITHVTHYPYQSHKGKLQSATAMLKIELSDLHIRDNGHFEITCRSTIPSFVQTQQNFADFQTRTVKVNIVPAPVATSSTKRLTYELVLLVIVPAICAIHSLIKSIALD